MVQWCYEKYWDLEAMCGVAKQLGIADKIRYLGNSDSIERLLSCADLVFQPSEHESFGLVPLEAMACEVPVIASDVGGMRELIDHGKDGFLLPARDVEAMARIAIELLSRPERLRELGRAARAKAQARFCSTLIVPRYEAFYEAVLQKSAREA